MAQAKETQSREHKQTTGAKQQEGKNNSNTIHTTHTHPQRPIPVPYTKPFSCTRSIALPVFTGKIAGSEERVGLAVRSAAGHITLNNRQHVAYGVRRQSAGSRIPIAVLMMAAKNSLPSESKARHAKVVKWAELTRCLRQHQLGGGRASLELYYQAVVD
jgi:hypothetical protein